MTSYTTWPGLTVWNTGEYARSEGAARSSRASAVTGCVCFVFSVAIRRLSRRSTKELIQARAMRGEKLPFRSRPATRSPSRRRCSERRLTRLQNSVEALFPSPRSTNYIGVSPRRQNSLVSVVGALQDSTRCHQGFRIHIRHDSHTGVDRSTASQRPDASPSTQPSLH